MARDALDTMRRAMSLHETVAATEQAKGPAADLRLMADAMGRAADLASQIAQIEDRRGITAPVEMPERLKVVFVDGADVCCRCGGPNVCEKCGAKKSPRRNERTMDEAIAETRARADAPQKLLPAPARRTPKVEDAPLIDVTPKRTELVQDNDYATSRGDSGRAPGSVMW